MSSPTSANPNKFVAAIQTLVFLARANTVCSSIMIADYVHSHPTFLRRVVAQLVRANLVQAHEGREGGYCLACPATQITLADVYRAIKFNATTMLLPLDSARGPALEVELREVLMEVVAETEQSMLEILGRHTIAEIAARTESCQ